MLGNFVSGRFTRRLGIDRMIMTGCAITTAGGLLCFAAAITGMLSPATLACRPFRTGPTRDLPLLETCWRCRLT